MHTHICGTLEAYAAFSATQAAAGAAQRQAEADAIGPGDSFPVAGFCEVCGAPADFLVDYQYGGDAEARQPNWRERLICPGCNLNNRARAAVGIILRLSGAPDTVYLTEQASPLLDYVRRQRPAAFGSEYLRDGTAPGKTNAEGVRHEDVTALSLADNAVGLIGTFDVLEHVPDYRRALREFLRCLKPGGHVVISVPFHLGQAETVARAEMRADGSIEHRLPAIYHGDPLDPQGILCFHDFGWDFLGFMRSIGFADAHMRFYWSRDFGYLGGWQSLIVAGKPASAAANGGIRSVWRRLVGRAATPPD